MAAKARNLARTWRTIAVLRQLVGCLFDPYQPELHYMRGPGPKWREKHLAQPAAAGVAIPSGAEVLA